MPPCRCSRIRLILRAVVSSKTAPLFSSNGMCLQRHPSPSHHFPGFRRHCRRRQVSMTVSHLHLSPPCVFPSCHSLRTCSDTDTLFSVGNKSRPVKLRPMLRIAPGKCWRLPSLHKSGLLKIGRANKAARPRKQQPLHNTNQTNNPLQSGGPQQSPPSLGTAASLVDAKGANTTQDSRGSRRRRGEVRWHYIHYTPQENRMADQSIWIPYK